MVLLRQRTLLTKYDDRSVVDWLLYIVVMANGVYSLYFTAYVFHTPAEIIAGYLSALLIISIEQRFKKPVNRYLRKYYPFILD